MGARGSTKRLDQQSRIVGEHQSRRIAAVMQRLFAGIRLEGRAVLNARWEFADSGYCLDLDAAVKRRLAKLTKFPGIRGREPNALHRSPFKSSRRIDRCTATSFSTAVR